MRKFLMGRAAENGPLLIRFPRTGKDVFDAPTDDNHILHENSIFRVPAISGNALVPSNGTVEIENPIAPRIPYMRIYATDPQDGDYHSPGSVLYFSNKTAGDFSRLLLVNKYAKQLLVHYYIYSNTFGNVKI